MDAKDFLEQINRIERTINAKTAEVSKLRDILYGVSAPMSNDPVQSSKTGDRMADIIAKIVDTENEINSLIDKYIDESKEIVKVIEQLKNPLHYTVIHKHYVSNMSFVEIAAVENFSYQYIVETHGKALKEIQNILNTYENI